MSGVLWCLHHFLSDLSGTSLTGTLSNSISSLRQLVSLNLKGVDGGDSALSGEIPDGLWTLPALRFIFFAYSIPLLYH